jgi:hypothetical protein
MHNKPRKIIVQELTMIIAVRSIILTNPLVSSVDQNPTIKHPCVAHL